MSSSSVPRRMVSAAPSPKVLAQAVTSVVVWVLAHYAISVDPEVEAALAVVLAAVAGYVVRPGAVTADLKAATLRSDAGYYEGVNLLFACLAFLVVIIIVVYLLRHLG